MGQSPYLYGFGEHEVFGEASGETVDVLAFPTGPSLTVLASSVPSAFFQYEPLASSFSIMSFMLAVFGPQPKSKSQKKAIKTPDIFVLIVGVSDS